LIARSLLGISSFEAAAPHGNADPWKELMALAADPGSGLAISGKPPIA
jgi:hypothetical protein